VRWLLAYRSKVGLKDFQIFIRQEKTINLWLKIEKDFTEQWKKGNRTGDWGVWL
jgi:hypothetical protein